MYLQQLKTVRNTCRMTAGKTQHDMCNRINEGCRMLGMQRRCVDAMLLPQGTPLVEHECGRWDENRRPERNWESCEWRRRWTPSPHPGKLGESHLTTAQTHTCTHAHSLAADEGSDPLISITSCPSKQKVSASSHLHSADQTQPLAIEIPFIQSKQPRDAEKRVDWFGSEVWGGEEARKTIKANSK